MKTILTTDYPLRSPSGNLNADPGRHTLPGLRRRLPLAASLALAGSMVAPHLQASLFILNESASGPANAFPVSNTDLLQTSLSSWTSNGGFAWNTPAVLFDGGHGPSGGAGGNHSTAPNGGQITFNLDLGASPLGYDLTEIGTVASWDTGRDGQEYSVEYSIVSDPGTFLLLGNVPQFNPSLPFADAHTRVRLTDTEGKLAENVARLRFTFTGFENGGTAYREIDVFGTAVPEPAHAGLAAGALLGALAYWRKRRQNWVEGQRVSGRRCG